MLVEHFGDKGYPIPTNVASNGIWHLLGVFMPDVKQWVVVHLDRLHFVDNRPSVRDLGVAYTPVNETIVETGKCLIKGGWIKPPPSRQRLMVTSLVKGIVKIGLLAGAVYAYKNPEKTKEMVGKLAFWKKEGDGN